MAYLEPEGYSEHYQTCTMECFVKDSYLAHFSGQSRNSKKESTTKKIRYISELTFRARKMKKIHS